MNRENEIINVRVDEIIPNRFQPRLAFNQNELKELSDSIKVHGIIQPLVLRRIADKYEIIAGERRYKAAIMAGLNVVPAIIMNLDDKESAEVAVVENLQRKDLTAIEEAQSYQKILNMGHVTQEELASRMGVTQPTIANKLRLLSLPEPVQQALLKNQISERHARSLLQIPDASLQVSMLGRIINERLTVRQTDEEISKILGRPLTPVAPTEPSVAPAQPRPTAPTPPVTPSPKPAVPPVSTPQTQSQSAPKPFDVDINKIKNESEDIIKEHKPSDIDMLLRKEPATEETGDSSSVNSLKKVSLEDIAANVDMGELVKPGSPAINPFQEVDPEIMNFEVPTAKVDPNVSQAPSSSLIEEFKQQNPTSYQAAPIPSAPSNDKSISSAINAVRQEKRKIEELGFNVETEEFDFEDMYQIIIKIKKD